MKQNKVRLRTILDSYSTRGEKIVKITIKTNPLSKRYWNGDNMYKIIKLEGKIEEIVFKMK